MTSGSVWVHYREHKPLVLQLIFQCMLLKTCLWPSCPMELNHRVLAIQGQNQAQIRNKQKLMKEVVHIIVNLKTSINTINSFVSNMCISHKFILMFYTVYAHNVYYVNIVSTFQCFRKIHATLLCCEHFAAEHLIWWNVTVELLMLKYFHDSYC